LANDYQREQETAAQQTAERLGIDLRVLYAESDSITQSQQLLEIIQSPACDVDGIMLEPTGGTAFPQVGHAAAAKGIA
jgi:ABC-type sugar transport system substrate-binding protein